MDVSFSSVGSLNIRSHFSELGSSFGRKDTLHMPTRRMLRKRWVWSGERYSKAKGWRLKDVLVKLWVWLGIYITNIILKGFREM